MCICIYVNMYNTYVYMGICVYVYMCMYNTYHLHIPIPIHIVWIVSDPRHDQSLHVSRVMHDEALSTWGRSGGVQQQFGEVNQQNMVIS